MSSFTDEAWGRPHSTQFLSLHFIYTVKRELIKHNIKMVHSIKVYEFRGNCFYAIPWMLCKI